MELSGRTNRQILLLTLLSIIIPMVVFPEQLGIQLGQFSVLSLAFETVFYGLVIYLVHRPENLSSILKASLFCLAARLVVGMLFGFMVVIMYGLNLKVALSLGLWSYLPGVLLHIAAMPLVLKPLISQMCTLPPSRTMVGTPPGQVSKVPNSSQGIANTVPRFAASQRTKPVAQSVAPAMTRPSARKTGDVATSVNGFDEAVNHVGAISSVELATLVDFEGMLLAGYVRDDLDAEDLAPLSILYFEEFVHVGNRMNIDGPERIELTMENKRLILARDDNLCLMVLAERQADDILAIRAKQGMEIAARYMEKKYNLTEVVNAEKSYV